MKRICDMTEPQCEEEAKYVLRLITIPKNQCQSHLLFKRIVACTKHAEYLCNDSEFKYEKLHSMKPKNVSNEQLIQERNLLKKREVKRGTK